MSSTSAAKDPEPVFTVTLPLPSIVVRSPAFNTAFAAVGVQTPEAQLMFWVAAEEIVTAACVGPAVKSAIADSETPAHRCAAARDLAEIAATA